MTGASGTEGADWRGLAALVLGAAILGLVPIGVRFSAEWGGLGALGTGFWRFALAAVPLLAWNYFRPPPNPAPLRIGMIVLCGLAFAADIGTYFLSIAATSVANATLLSNLAPVVVVAVSAFVLRKRVGRLGWLGAIIAVIGVSLLVRRSVGVPTAVTGDLLGVLSAVFYGMYQLAVASARRNQSALRVMAGVAVVGALVLGPCTVLAGEPFLPHSASGWAVLCGLAWVTQIGGQGLITWSLAHLPASFSSVVLLVQPIVAALLGWLCFAEAIGPWQGLGAILVLVGIVVARRALT
jgi:drug/metabolite transporter (DMT)-like permease